MRTHDQQLDRMHTRRTAGAGTCQWHALAVALRSVSAAMVDTLSAAKINPNATPGGHPSRREP
ncbi:MAG: hypothetical protein HY699_15050 [Deltaproteobacteria bacterium]|nr:hypothetical protein [Deltaproteobacteria bacterium]